MPAPYNMSLLANNTNGLSVVTAANDYTGGIMVLVFLIIIGAALFFALRGDNRNREALVATAFVLMILSIFTALLGWLSPYMVGAFVFLFIGALVALIMKR